MSKKLKVIGLQIQPVLGDKIANYKKVSELLAQYKWFEADLVVLPELFNAGVDHKNFEEMAEAVPDQTTMFLSGMAEKYNTNIIGGSFVSKSVGI